MKQPTQNLSLYILLLQLASFACLANESALRFQGAVKYQISKDEVVLSAGRIANLRAHDSGAIGLRLIATVQPTHLSSFHLLADASLADGESVPFHGGQIPAHAAVQEVKVTAPFFAPPEGVYYVHLIVSRTGDKLTSDSGVYVDRNSDFFDVYSFPQTVTFGAGSSPVLDPDDHGDSFDKATVIWPESYTDGVLSMVDVDVFEISFNRAGLLTLYAAGTTDTSAILFDADGNVLAQDDDSLAPNFYISQHLVPGTYYVEVRGDSMTPAGGYTLRSTFVAGLEPAPESLPTVTGIYFDPASPGQGFSLLHNANGITVFFFGHTREGERLWLVSELGPASVKSGSSFVLNMLEVADGSFGRPDPESLRVWGWIMLSFGGCGEATAVLNGVDGVYTVGLEKLAGTPANRCDQ